MRNVYGVNELLQRIPELRALLHEPSCRRAIESGSPFQVYRALLFARLFKRCPDQQDLLDTLLAQRRLFARSLPEGRASSLTWGSRRLGCQWQDDSATAAQHDVDGSFLASLRLFIAGLPTFSLGTYLIQPAIPPNTSSKQGHQWHVLAQVPERFSRWLTARLLAGLAALTIGSVGWFAYQQTHTQEILVINAFSDALEVELDGQTLRVPAHAGRQLRVRIGKLRGQAQTTALPTRPAFVVDQLEQHIQHSAGFTVWNLAGAAPLLIAGASATDNDNDPTVACGQRVFNLGKDVAIQYLTPSQPEREGGAQLATCQQYAQEHQQIALLSHALLTQALLLDWEMPATLAAINAARANNDVAAIQVAQHAARAKPDQLAYQVLLQDTRVDAGQRELIVQELQQTTKPESPITLFLAAQLQTGADGIAAMQVAHERFPQEPTILHSLVWRKAIHGYYAEAYQDLQGLHQLAPGTADRLFDLEVQLLLTQNRPLDAIKLLQNTVRDRRAERRADHAADFALVARQSRIDPEFWLKELPAAKNDLGLLDFYRVRAGLKPYQNPILHSPQVKLALALRSNPAQAITLAAAQNPLQLAQLSKAQLSLLLAEANRLNQTTLIAQTRPLLGLNKADASLLQQFVRGENVDIDHADLDLEVQSAAFLVRARNTQISPAERNQLRSRAAQTDLLHSVISTALAQW